MVEAVRRGMIDKTQGHSLAELADQCHCEALHGVQAPFGHRFAE